MKRPRFEVVRTDAGWHSRFVAANGRIVWTTEVYERERAARRAIELLTGPAPARIVIPPSSATALTAPVDMFVNVTSGTSTAGHGAPRRVEIREVDERAEGNATNGGAVLVVDSDG